MTSSLGHAALPQRSPLVHSVEIHCTPVRVPSVILRSSEQELWGVSPSQETLKSTNQPEQYIGHHMYHTFGPKPEQTGSMPYRVEVEVSLPNDISRELHGR